MPAQKPGQSFQSYGTPWALIHAIEKRFGAFSVDLAASRENKKAPLFISEERNSLIQPWHTLTGLLWLNPPFAHLAPWAAKCAAEAELGARIIMLTPASVGSNWFAEHCEGKARTLFIRPRIIYEGETTPYPKDCMLTLWGFGAPGYELWKWQ